MFKIFILAWNDLYIEFSKPATIIYFLILPLVFTFIIGVATNGNKDKTVETRKEVLVINMDDGPLSLKFIELMNNSIEIKPILINNEEISNLIQDKKNSILLNIPADFSRNLLTGKKTDLMLKPLKPGNNTVIIEEAIKTILRNLNTALGVANQSVTEIAERNAFKEKGDRDVLFQRNFEIFFQNIINPSIKTSIATKGNTSNPIPAGFSQSSAGQLVMWVLIVLLGASRVFVNERLGGTLRRLLITPTPKTVILSGKFLAWFLMGLAQMIILIGFGSIFLGVSYGHSFAALALIVISFGLAATSLGVMLGAFARTVSQAASLTSLFALILSALGGAWWPLEVTPPVYQQIVKLFPSTWAIIGFQNLMTRNLGIESVILPSLALFGFALIFFIVGIMKLKYE